MLKLKLPCPWAPLPSPDAPQVQAINLLQSLEPPEGEAGGGNAPLPANTIEPDIRSAVYASAARNGYWVRAAVCLSSLDNTGLVHLLCVSGRIRPVRRHSLLQPNVAPVRSQG